LEMDFRIEVLHFARCSRHLNLVAHSYLYVCD
jgi:hypothetical protein